MVSICLVYNSFVLLRVYTTELLQELMVEGRIGKADESNDKALFVSSYNQSDL